MKIFKSSHLYATITVIFWALGYVLTGVLLRHFSATGLAFLRFMLASFVLFIVVIVLKIPPPKKNDIPLFIYSGLCGFTLYMLAFNLGNVMVSTATGSILVATAPIWAAVLAVIIYHEKLTKLQILSIVVEFAGILTLTLNEDGFSLNMGVLWLLLAAFVLSFFNLLQRRLTKEYTGLQTSIYSIFCGTALLAVFLPTSIPQLFTASTEELILLGVLAVFPSSLAYICWSKAFEFAQSTTQVTNYMFVTPLIATFFSFLINNEIPDPRSIIGGLIILSGLILFYRSGAKKPVEDEDSQAVD